MSKGKGKLIWVLFVFVMLAMSGCNAMDEMSNGFNNANPTPMVKAWVPPSQRGDLTVEQENALLSQVEFRLDGAPTGEAALFLNDVTIVTYLTPGQTTRLPLVGNERCGIALKIRGADGEWERVASLGCIDHAPYASVNFTVDGMSARVSRGAWK